MHAHCVAQAQRYCLGPLDYLVAHATRFFSNVMSLEYIFIIYVHVSFKNVLMQLDEIVALYFIPVRNSYHISDKTLIKTNL